MSITELRERAVRHVTTLYHYWQCMRGGKGILVGFLVILFPPIRGRLIRVRLPNSSLRVLVRLGTSDIEVFNSTFRSEEYGIELPSLPDVIVDAGAYTGLSAVYFALRYPDAKVIALEPSDANFEVLERNVRGFKNVLPVRAALWPASGDLELIDPGYGAWAYRVEATGGAGDQAARGAVSRRNHEVRAITVRDVLASFGLDRIGLLKVDVEGSELEIFADSGSWIDKVDAIFAELHDRFKPGCTRAFIKAVDGFPIEVWRGETVLVARRPVANDDEGAAKITLPGPTLN